MPESPLATPAEVAVFLRTTTAKLANDRYRGVGPKFVKHGRRVLYRWDEVSEWVNANMIQRTDERPGAA
ncbi:DNA-binding protein [Rhodococcus hoagii]|nr:DNA-binding protein [Prescottella equi]MBM4668525.1 DNA-binding protein [Prescottella equi]NKV88744.1 DNA-binding protein [Prescottella equi]